MQITSELRWLPSSRQRPDLTCPQRPGLNPAASSTTVLIVYWFCFVFVFFKFTTAVWAAQKPNCTTLTCCWSMLWPCQQNFVFGVIFSKLATGFKIQIPAPWWCPNLNNIALEIPTKMQKKKSLSGQSDIQDITRAKARASRGEPSVFLESTVVHMQTTEKWKTVKNSLLSLYLVLTLLILLLGKDVKKRRGEVDKAFVEAEYEKWQLAGHKLTMLQHEAPQCWTTSHWFCKRF